MAIRRRATRRETMAIAGLVGLLLFLAPVSPARAQTPETAVGLGAPVPAIDARAAALGGTGLGLPTGSLSARNPADIALLGRPSLGITYAPENVTVEGPGTSPSTGRSRLGVIRGAVPIGDWAVGVAFAPELDQDWQVQFSDTLASEEGTFPFTEQRSLDGGVSSVNFTVARRLGRVSLGVEYGILTGRAQQRFRRDFAADVDGDASAPFSSGGRATWQYSGSRIRAGAAARVSERIHVGADVFLQSDLTAERDTIMDVAPTRTYDMPAGFEVGASGRVSDRLLLTAAGGWTGWSGARGGSTEFVASNVTWAGIGAEYTGTRFLGANVPLRLGLRRTQLPFHAPDDAQASETAVTFGLGVRVSEERARIDLGFEIGSRGDLDDSTFEEGFRRVSLSFALFED